MDYALEIGDVLQHSQAVHELPGLGLTLLHGLWCCGDRALHTKPFAGLHHHDQPLRQ